MHDILTEAPIATSVAAWKRQHDGQAPDVNSPEFKAFKKQVDKDYNLKQQTKSYNGENIDSFVKTLEKITQQSPQNFPQEFYNALTNLQKKDKVNLCNKVLQIGSLDTITKTWVQVIGNLYNSNKNESAEITLKAMTESAKYPWISGLVNHRLFKEDDFNLDNFDASVAGVGGMDTKNTTTQDDTTTTSDTINTQQDSEEFDLDDFATDNTSDDLHISPAGGAIDSIGGGMGADDGVDPMAGIDPDTPTFRVIDVVFDEKNPEASPKVKVQNTETGEIEIKDIFELDI